MAEFDPVNSWFEKGFRIRRQKAARGVDIGGKRDKARTTSSGSPARRGSVIFSSGAKNKNIKSVIKKSPEVMVKITGNSKGLSSVKHHLDYISRNGEVELVNERGETINGKAELKGLREELKSAQIPEDSKKREFLHVMFSMPKGTPEKAMREAVAAFASEEFSNRRYVMAFHDDTDHSHIHLNVGTRDISRADEPRLSPRKDDLFRWRQGFADKLTELGIDAAASDRKHRFNYRKSENSTIRQIRADNPKSDVFNQRRAESKALDREIKASMNPAKAFVGALRPPRVPKVYDAIKNELQAALSSNERPTNPAFDNIENNRKLALASWGEVAKNLEVTGDKELAQQVRDLMQAGKDGFVSRNQELYDTAMKERNKNINQNIGL